MLQLQYKIKNLPFEYPFKLAKGIKTQQSTLLVSLRLGRAGGFGEATEILYYDNTIERMTAVLESKRRDIERYALNSPQRFHHFLHHLIPDEHFVTSALDIAAWDLWAKMNRKTVRQLMELAVGEEPLTNYTIGIHDAAMIERIVKEKPYPIYKLKLGGEDDLLALKTLRSATDALIRIDANEAWTLDDAKVLLPVLEECRIELIEQPFKRDDLESLRSFRELCSIPVIADEACADESDLMKCIGHYDGINIKLSKVGGLTPALEMITKIKDAGKKVMLGGMCESTIGATAIAQLLPLADYADIDGPLLLKENFGYGLTYENGRISLPQGLGLGISFQPPQ